MLVRLKLDMRWLQLLSIWSITLTMSFKHKHKLIQIQIDMLQIQRYTYIHLIDDIDHVLQIQMQIDTCANTNRYNYKLKCRIYNIHIDHVLQIQVQIDTNTIWYAANTKLCPPDRWHWPCPSGPLLRGPSQKCASPFKRNCLGVSDKCNIDVILFEGRAVFFCSVWCFVFLAIKRIDI